jgi:hypothetical protein
LIARGGIEIPGPNCLSIDFTGPVKTCSTIQDLLTNTVKAMPTINVRNATPMRKAMNLMVLLSFSGVTKRPVVIAPGSDRIF